MVSRKEVIKMSREMEVIDFKWPSVDDPKAEPLHKLVQRLVDEGKDAVVVDGEFTYFVLATVKPQVVISEYWHYMTGPGIELYTLVEFVQKYQREWKEFLAEEANLV
jgi:hypothetical protein